MLLTFHGQITWQLEPGINQLSYLGLQVKQGICLKGVDRDPSLFLDWGFGVLRHPAMSRKTAEITRPRTVKPSQIMISSEMCFSMC